MTPLQKELQEVLELKQTQINVLYRHLDILIKERNQLESDITKIKQKQKEFTIERLLPKRLDEE